MVGWKVCISRDVVIQAAEAADRSPVVFKKADRQTPHLTPADMYQGQELIVLRDNC